MTAIGALLGLGLTIVLIIRKQNPTYCLILGALAGGLCGGLGLVETVAAMIGGVKDVVPAILRILAAGVLSGVLVKTGAAFRIAGALVRGLGAGNTLPALALATLLLTATGVFIDVAVITIAPIALAAGRSLPAVSRAKLLLAMIGGGKCGNIISPNPNTIIAAENMGAPLPSVMLAGVLPALLGFVALVVLLRFIKLPGEGAAGADGGGAGEGGGGGDAGGTGCTVDAGSGVDAGGADNNNNNANAGGGGATAGGGDAHAVGAPAAVAGAGAPPALWAGIAGPALAIALLALRPLCGVVVDPLVALPAGGVAGILCMRRTRQFGESLAFGLEKMGAVALLLIGTGAIAGIIKGSVLGAWILHGLESARLGGVLIAPVSGAFMSAATASTTAGATVASASFAPMILAAGVSAVWGAAMINAGATVLDHLPHGSFFHATAGAMQVNLRERLRLIPWETLIGLVLAALTTGAAVAFG
jgi:GntP family gluconate:H+ symporter